MLVEGQLFLSTMIGSIWRIALSITAIVTLTASEATPHEIPTDVTVRAFVKPEGPYLRLLVRVPLEAMRDMSVPTRDRGYLDLATVREERVLEDAAILWIADYVEMYEAGALLAAPELVAARVSLPTDPSFGRYEDALAHTVGPPMSDDTEIYWQQGVLDVLFHYAIDSDRSAFSMNPGLERLGIRVVNVLRFVSADGVVRSFDFPGNPGRVPLDPNWAQVALRFVELGFFHILDGTDHLLFLLCLVIPFREFRSLVIIVTSFTVAHSITLIASTYGYAPDALWFPPLVETLIALSILYMAFENIIGAKLRKRWVITFGFGLIHGFGFAFVLGQTLQFAGSHLTASLLAFNVGVELGQLLVLLVTIPLLNAFFRIGVTEKVGTIYLSALITHSAWHWMVERAEQFRQFSWPALNASLLASLMRLLMLGVLFAAIVWLVSVLKPQEDKSDDGEASAGADP
jgi:hypothetical protein